MLDHGLQRRTAIEPALIQTLVFTDLAATLEVDEGQRRTLLSQTNQQRVIHKVQTTEIQFLQIPTVVCHGIQNVRVYLKHKTHKM